MPKSAIWLTLLAAGVCPMPAYRPAVDSVGPLTAKIEGPEQITAAGAPVEVTVVLENGGDAALQGTVELRVIDRWQASPAGAVPFSLAPKGSARLAFAVRAAEVTFNAHYPISASADFEWRGRRQRAHPILIVPVKLPNPPRPNLPPDAKPVSPPPAAARVAPRSAFPPAGASRALGTAGGFQVRVWPGRRGMLDATVGFRNGARRLYFRGFQASVLGAALEDPASAIELVEAREEPAHGRYRVRHHFKGWAGPFDVLTEAWIEKGALRVRFALENAASRPWLNIHLEDVAAGPWSSRAARIYAGAGNVMQDAEAFRLRYNGHFLSTSYIGMDFEGGVSIVQGVDVPPDHLAADPDAGACSLHTPHNQVISFIPGRDVWNSVKLFRELNAPRAAAGVPRLAGRFTFDLWRGRYADTAKALRQAFRYGLTDAVVIWHRWQRWGYDYRLPDIYPPSLEYGALDEFQDLVAACKQNGVLFAPHDNYVDFYPDSDDFSYDNIAFTADRRPQTAFMNRGAGAQSYHPRSDRVLPFVQRNIRMIKDGFAPNAYFIDVWSSEPPYDYYTSDGQFFDRIHTRDVWRSGFAWIRDFLGGAPQISEAGADQYIGWLDGGAGAHMRAEGGPERSNVWRIETSDTERVPWFDAAYHDVFVLQGAGYPGRYNSGQDSRTHGIYSDDYIATEVMTGHPSMVWDAFSRDVVRKYWLLHDAMRGLALRRMERFAFAGNDLHRHEIQWDNGGFARVNRGAEDWTAEGHVLPQYGFYTRIPGAGGTVEAAVERRDGLIVEWSRSPSTIYVNARPVTPEPAARGGGRAGQGPDPRLPRMNQGNREVGFGAVSTNGGLRLVRSGESLEITPLPDSPAFALTIRWAELPWKLAVPKTVEIMDGDGHVLRTLPAMGNAGQLRLNSEAGAFSYRIH
ncbi:MAG: hypothetical protein LAQ30_11415 [Acidobacteriia bacterium]|nr:hypothetical protein [Terriglobia bacterium]